MRQRTSRTAPARSAIDGDISGACLGSNFDQATTGICLTTPFDPGKKDAALDALCQGFDEEDADFPRCDFCDFF